MSHDRHLDVEERSEHGRAEQRLIALVIGVRHEGDARREKLGSRRLDEHPRAVGSREPDAVVVAVALAVLELGLGHRGAEGDVPEGRRLGLVGLTATEVAQERPLRRSPGGGVDGLVGVRPVD